MIVSILRACGLDSITRVERSRRYLLDLDRPLDEEIEDDHRVLLADPIDAPDPLLSDALAAGYAVSIVGRGWTPFVDPGLVECEDLDDEALRRLYPRCRAVLCAQSARARAQGFPGFLPLEVAASGGVPVCSPVDGAAEFLEGFASA